MLGERAPAFAGACFCYKGRQAGQCDSGRAACSVALSVNSSTLVASGNVAAGAPGGLCLLPARSVAGSAISLATPCCSPLELNPAQFHCRGVTAEASELDAGPVAAILAAPILEGLAVGAVRVASVDRDSARIRCGHQPCRAAPYIPSDWATRHRCPPGSLVTRQWHATAGCCSHERRSWPAPWRRWCSTSAARCCRTWRSSCWRRLRPRRRRSASLCAPPRAAHIVKGISDTWP